ncbi:MAG: hypothetical protein ACK4YU_05115 [Paracoccus sp. (in: a-proteobacteria)]
MRAVLGAGDLVFRLTTRPLTDNAVEDSGLFDAIDTLEARGWRMRSAGPRWFVVWHRDTERLARLRVVVLPAPHIGLAPHETAALLAAQLHELGLACPDRGALGASQRDIWLKLAIAQGNS